MPKIKICPVCFAVAEAGQETCRFCPRHEYEVVFHFPQGDDIKVLAHGRSMDEAVTRAKQIEQVAPSIANTTRRI